MDDTKHHKQPTTSNHKQPQATRSEHKQPQATTSNHKQPQANTSCITESLREAIEHDAQRRVPPLNDNKKALLSSWNALAVCLAISPALFMQPMHFTKRSTVWHDHTTPLNDNKHSGD